MIVQIVVVIMTVLHQSARLPVNQFAACRYVLPVNHFGPARYDCPGPQRASGQRSIIDSPVALRRDAFITRAAIIDSSVTLRHHASLRAIIDSPQRDASLPIVIDTSQVTRCRNFPLDNSSV